MRRVVLMGAMVLTLTVATVAVAATTGWKVQRSPNPSGATFSQLSGVSCASPSACTAVGQSTEDFSVYSTVVERWNGNKWSIQQAPAASTTYNDLSAVSCTSPNACVAVGFYDNKADVELPLAVRWNGKKWSRSHPANPTGASGASLAGVSCTSARSCTAVGTYTKTSVNRTLVERWNGETWSIKHSPNPTGSTLSDLEAVSCASQRACQAVGQWRNGSAVFTTLAESWNGKKWSIQHTSNPSGATSSDLSGISCTAPAACTAVGDYENSSNKNRTLAERWNGKKWSIQQTRNPTSDPNKFLYDVSCTSATACTAAGETAGEIVWDATLVEHWNGSKWTVEKTPDPGADNQLSGVSCSSTSTCTAVGWYQNTPHPQKTLVEHR